MSNPNMRKEVDVLIIGAGVAGAVAASVLAKRGAKVAIIDKPGGATIQSSGAVDVAHCNDYSGRPLGFIESAKVLAKGNIYHPYAKTKEQNIAKVSQALHALKELASEVSFFLREDGANLALATQLGTIKHAAMVQQSQAFDLNDLSSGDSLLVIGFSGLPSFDARTVARMLKWSISHSLKKEVSVTALELEFPAPHSFWRSPMEMALGIDTENNFARLEAALSQVVENLSLKHKACFIPAIAGRKSFHQLNRRFNEGRGTPVFELLATPHSVPGARLNDALKNGLSKLPIEHFEGEAVSAHRVNGKVSSVTAISKEGPCEFVPNSVILASGRFLAGGFVRQGVRRERVFGLPIWHEGKLVEEAHVSTLTVNGPANKQPIFCAGLQVDERFRPFDQMMELFALNLFAAGSSIGGYDAGGVDSGLGLAAFTAYMSAFHTV